MCAARFIFHFDIKMGFARCKYAKLKWMPNETGLGLKIDLVLEHETTIKLHNLHMYH